MITKQKDGQFSIFGLGQGEGAYNITLSELKELELDIKNIILNDDTQYIYHLMGVLKQINP